MRSAWNILSPLFLLAGVVSASTVSFTNSTELDGPGSVSSTGPFSLYPSTITVSGFGGGLTDVTVRIDQLTDASPANLDMMLVGPTGAGLVFFTGAGNGGPAVAISVTLDDAGVGLVPQSSPLVSGTFKPTSYAGGPGLFASPAPATAATAPVVGTSTFATVFNGTDPNGTWSLYIMDADATDTGKVAGGWTLTVTAPAATGPPTTPEQSTAGLLSLGLIGLGIPILRSRKIR